MKMNSKGSTKKTIRFLSLLLAAFLFLEAQGFTVFAETVSGNNALVGAGSPANPVHHCTNKNDGTDDTDFSYIYFGSYPQSEVTDEATRQAIDSAISQGLGQAAGTAESSEGTDVWVNETRYRRISKDDTNFSRYFDNVPNNGYRYFKWERIKWRVLQNDGNTLFVVANKVIDCKDYNEEFTNTTWETSTIRSWLNDSFYNTAFSSSEQGAIVTQNVENEDNPEYGTEGGNNTSDNIYLLSISEVTNEMYGFCSDYSTYSMSRRMQTSDYANARGVGRNSSNPYEGNCWWWLRSPGDYDDCYDAASVDTYGYVSRSGRNVDTYNVGVCPALHINLSSGIWSMAERGKIINLQAVKRRKVYDQGEKLNLDDFTVMAVYEDSKQILTKDSYVINTSGVDMNTPGNYELEISYKQMDVTVKAFVAITVRKKTKEGTPANPVHYCTNKDRGTDYTDYTDFSYVYFGSYPQSEVTDEATRQAIDSAISQGKGESAGTAENSEGTDVWVNETKYRRISKDDTNDDEYFDDMSTKDGYRYFKWEQIKWRVLQNNGSTLFVVADRAVDCKDYNEEHTSNTWENSTIRNWMNTSFYNTAFSSSEQGAIVTQNIVNEKEYGTEGGNNTNDNIYLLSISEVTNETYEFCSDGNTGSMSRRMKTSDYANARGTWRDKDGDCDWCLRTPTRSGLNDGAYVVTNGEVSPEESYSNGGICPALHINLSSDTWSDATSDEGKKENNLISLQASKTKKVYEQGEKLNLDDLTVTAVYEDFKQILTKDSYVINTSGIDMDTPGNYELEISYTQKDVTKKTVITITVKEKAGEDTRQPDSNIKNQLIKVTKLTITAPSKKLVAGQKVKLTLMIEPGNASEKTVVWETSNKKYAAIDEKGILTLKKAGIGKTVTITAAAKDGSGKKATIKIKIMEHAVKGIKLKAPSKTLQAGRSMTVKATVSTTGKSVNKTLKWQSSNTKYATVNKKGKVTAKKAGKGKTVTITATSTDGSNKKAKVKIKIK